MALAMFFFASADIIAKFMTSDYHPMQIVGIRQLGLFTGALVYLSVKGLSMLRSRRPGLRFLHGLCATLWATLFVVALSFIPLTDAASIAFAARQVISRILGATEPTATTVVFTALTSVMLLGLVQPFVWRPIPAGDLWLFARYAGAAGLGEFLLIKAQEIAEAVVVAPLQHTMIFRQTGFSFFVFDTMPDAVTFAGAGIIIASGI